jgi:hypothetical protein
MSIQAIPTKWRGVQFRSRLEARWAAFFTAVGWEWSYEPLDLKGYIPDFILHLHEDVLVEVKPFMRLDDDVISAAHEKIVESGWHGDVPEDMEPSRDCVVVGARLFDATRDAGVNAFAMGMMQHGDMALLGQCGICGRLTIASALMSYHCRVCGENKGWLPEFDSDDDRCRVLSAWDRAGNEVQWKGRS